MRILIYFGAPLDMTTKENKNDTSQPGIVYNDISDNEREQISYMSDFSQKIMDLIDEFEKDNEGGLKVIIFSLVVADIRFYELVE